MVQTIAPTLVPTSQALETFFSALQEYPDFQDGLDTGRLAYREIYDYEEIPFNADALHKEIEESLTKRGYDIFLRDLARTNDYRVEVPYFFLLGFVLGHVCESYTAQLEACNV